MVIWVCVGAGGHAKVVLDAAIAAGLGRPVVVDDDPMRVETIIMGVHVKLRSERTVPRGTSAHVAIGNNLARCRVFNELSEFGCIITTIMHPRATVSSDAKIAAGSFLAAGAVIAPGAMLGIGCIVNHCAVVDHDCDIGPWTHLAPNVALGGGVKIGSHCLIGTGATILPGISIGDRCTVGAGAVVTRHVADASTVSGVPAINMEKR